MSVAVRTGGLIAWGCRTTNFLCFTTSRHFDPRRGRRWSEAAPELQKLIQEEFQCQPRALAFAGQVHGATVREVTARNPYFLEPECDGLWSRERGTFLVIRTADCLPVVLYDEEAEICAALHAGWKGTFANITATGIESMVAAGAERERIRMAIAPRICADNYEVSEELAAQFDEKFGHLGTFHNGRLLDLPRLNTLQAMATGVIEANIEDCGLCTFKRDDMLHSHRRQEFDRGQQFTVCGWCG